MTWTHLKCSKLEGNSNTPEYFKVWLHNHNAQI